jgi:hypothetical protein
MIKSLYSSFMSLSILTLLCSLEGARRAFNHSGEFNGEATPVPIPNTEVKLSRAENTWLETARKGRSSPDFFVLF